MVKRVLMLSSLVVAFWLTLVLANRPAKACVQPFDDGTGFCVCRFVLVGYDFCIPFGSTCFVAGPNCQMAEPSPLLEQDQSATGCSHSPGQEVARTNSSTGGAVVHAIRRLLAQIGVLADEVRQIARSANQGMPQVRWSFGGRGLVAAADLGIAEMPSNYR